MKRSLTLMVLLAAMLIVAACGGRETGQSGRSASDGPQQRQAQSDQQGASEGTAREGATRKRAQANDESSGLSVETIQGERVNLGGQGDVTALYFMAGW